MNVLRKYAVLAVAAISILAAAAQDGDEVGLASWAESFPETIDGVKIYAPQMEEGSIRISDLVDFSNRSQDRVYVNILSDIRSRADGETEAIENADHAGYRLKIIRKSPAENGNVSYNYTVALQMTDDMLSFLVYDISISFKERGIVPRTMAIEKMKPSENRRHKELVEGMVVDAARYIGRLSDAVNADNAGPVTHWNEIRNNEIVRGMNPTEVLLVRGKPSSSRPSGRRLKWMYGNDHVVVFTDSVVTTVL